MTASRTASLRMLRGEELGPTAWREVTQDDVNEFGRIAGDNQWIHVDPDRARREGPFGGTIVHGALILTIATTFAGTLLPVSDARMVVNGGVSSARLRRPLSVGANVRGIASIVDVEDMGEATVVMIRVSVTAEHSAVACASALVNLVVHG